MVYCVVDSAARDRAVLCESAHTKVTQHRTCQFVLRCSGEKSRQG